jgi:CMP-N,N'-diacetyllegionaminic acid synthase
MKCVAFIPARSGSKRVEHKNIRTLQGHPLMAFTIQVALDSGVFSSVICATDSELYADVARHYGAEVPFLRGEQISGDKSPDIEWVTFMLTELSTRGMDFDAFSILRPTSPFRKASSIREAWQLFLSQEGVDSLRAVEKCAQHPGKMWVLRGQRLLPLLPFTLDATPWHSSQYASLPEIYVQNASLEIAWTKIAKEKASIAGESVIPLVSQGFEGFDINEPEDFLLAQKLIDENRVELPNIQTNRFNFEDRGVKLG